MAMMAKDVACDLTLVSIFRSALIGRGLMASRSGAIPFRASAEWRLTTAGNGPALPAPVRPVARPVPVKSLVAINLVFAPPAAFVLVQVGRRGPAQGNGGGCGKCQ